MADLLIDLNKKFKFGYDIPQMQGWYRSNPVVALTNDTSLVHGTKMHSDDGCERGLPLRLAQAKFGGAEHVHCYVLLRKSKTSHWKQLDRHPKLLTGGEL